MNTVLISGAAGNLGHAVVKHFLSRGDKVIGLVHHKKENQSKKNYQEVEVDLTDEEEVKIKLKPLLEKYKKIDTAVLTAGGFKAGNLSKTKVVDLKSQYQLNFITAYTITKVLLPHFEKNKVGKLFFIGSKPGLDTSEGKGAVAYSLAKSQLFQFANVINATYNDSISAQVIVPSTIDTPQNRKAVPNADFGKWEKPEDIARIIGRYSERTKCDKTVIVVREEA